MALDFTYEVQISCTPARLIGLIAETLAETMGNEKPADLVPGRSDQRVSEGGLRGSSGAKGKGAAALRGLSDSSIAVLPGNVNRSINNADPGFE
jgi:hypothetical protein